ncbi:MAG TPA: hypothetical protein VFZ61_16725 [Polyangiales bacterium]
MQLGAQSALALLVLRALPVLCAFCASEAPARHKLSGLLGYTAAASAAAHLSLLGPLQLMLSYLYLALPALLAFALPWRRPGVPLLVVLFGACLALPALLLPGYALILLLGWDVVLSAYSYCVQVPPAQRCASEYVFFVFVDPSLVYARRAVRVADPRWNAAALRRVGLGLALVGASGATAAALDQGSTVAAKPLRCAMILASHMGLAHVQIGLMQQLGVRVAERYAGLFAVRTPREFWLRWNSYVGSWARLHVFKPMARTMLRHGYGRSQPGRQRVHALCLASTFLALGALHDAFVALSAGQLTCAMTLWFGLNAGALLLWEASSRRLRCKGRRWGQALRAAAFGLVVLGVAAALP